ncbi:MAG: BREX-3 system phosphatase PglZ [Fibrobacteria bacterium]|nr:BREX-3 system phosphatase PglZ [Fibrobacteria bacterium]
MSSWRDIILKDFVPNVSKLTLVADPDQLLTEEKLTFELRKRGFDLIEFNDPIEFRYAYESQYRSIWDRGEHTDLVVILRLQDTELDSLPYDLLQAGRTLSFNLGDIFPNLSYPVIEKLDRGLLDSLFNAQNKFSPDRMGDNATKDFILRHIYGIASELITTDVELIRALLRLHYGKLHIPEVVTDRLITSLCENGGYKTWPISEIVPDENAFFSFLQERWPIFISGFDKSGKVKVENLKYPGPEHLPFDHQDIKVYIDNLFLEGKLTPIDATNIELGADTCVHCGINTVSADKDGLRISRLFKLVEKEMPNLNARYSDWTSFSLKWAELLSLVFSGNNIEQQAILKDIGDCLTTIFTDWLTERYSSLINLPPTSPAMLHHIPRSMAREMENSPTHRTALIVIDGLSMDQWVTIRHFFQKQDCKLNIRESGVFAWIPTLTSVSRQTIFSGKPPLYFPSSINSTNKEEKLWKQFWEGNGMSKLEVAYKRGLGDGDVSGILESTINPNKTKVVGLVVDKVDKIMHGMQLGSAGMHNQIMQWCKSGFLFTLVSQLLDYGYDIWLTADHGNIECKGQGRPSEGVLAETRGERVRVYPTPELRSNVAGIYTFAHEWQPVGLPANYFPLIAGGHNAFLRQGETIVGHGGIAIEEVIVPLIKIRRKKR